MKKLPEDFKPGFTTVECSKDGKQRTGNDFLRFLVKTNLKAYRKSTTESEKGRIVSKIIKMIRMEGCFARKVNGVWYDVGDKIARQRIEQALESSLRASKSLSKSKEGKKRRRPASIPKQSAATPATTDFEPLPLSEAVVDVKFDLSSAATASDDDASFQEAIDEMMLHDFSSPPKPSSTATVVSLK